MQGEGSTGRGCSAHTLLPFPGFLQVRASPKGCCQRPREDASAHRPPLTRLPAALARVGGRLVLGGPGLLQALRAVAVPVGICTRKRQSGLRDRICHGRGSDRTRPASAAPPPGARSLTPSIHFHPGHRQGDRPSAVPCASAPRSPRGLTTGAAGPPRPLASQGRAKPPRDAA